MLLAIDPATKTGVTYKIDGVWVTELWDFTLKPKTKKRPKDPNGKRLRGLFDKLFQLHKKHPITHILCEGAKGFSRGQAAVKTSHQLRGVIELFCSYYNVQYDEENPSVIKKYCTGNGRATKQEMIDYARRKGYEGFEENEADSFCVYIYSKKYYSKQISP